MLHEIPSTLHLGLLKHGIIGFDLCFEGVAQQLLWLEVGSYWSYAVFWYHASDSKCCTAMTYGWKGRLTVSLSCSYLMSSYRLVCQVTAASALRSLDSERQTKNLTFLTMPKMTQKLSVTLIMSLTDLDLLCNTFYRWESVYLKQIFWWIVP